MPVALTVSGSEPIFLARMRNLTAVTSLGFRSSERVRPAPSISSNQVRLQLQLHGLRSLQVVVDGDREGDLVVLRQGDGQVDVHEEVLEDAQRGAAPPSAPPLDEADAVSRQVVIESAKLTFELGDALVVGDEGGLPEQGFGEVLAHCAAAARLRHHGCPGLFPLSCRRPSPRRAAALPPPMPWPGASGRSRLGFRHRPAERPRRRPVGAAAIPSLSMPPNMHCPWSWLPSRRRLCSSAVSRTWRDSSACHQDCAIWPFCDGAKVDIVGVSNLPSGPAETSS